MDITITNISSATVVISAPDARFRRELTPGRKINVTKEIYEELIFDPGFNSLIRGHYIKVDKVAEDDMVETPETKIYSAAEIEKMLDTLDVTNFAKFLPTAAEAEKDTVVKLAVEKGITNSAFTALIKKYCGVDVINAISIKHQSEEK